jgi:hypothetical protein
MRFVKKKGGVLHVSGVVASPERGLQQELKRRARVEKLGSALNYVIIARDKLNRIIEGATMTMIKFALEGDESEVRKRAESAAREISYVLKDLEDANRYFTEAAK